MKIDNRYIVNVNDDNTKTIFDLDTQQFFKLNRTCTIIFDNFEKENKEIAQIITNEFETEDANLALDVELAKLELRKNFYEE